MTRLDYFAVFALVVTTNLTLHRVLWRPNRAAQDECFREVKALVRGPLHDMQWVAHMKGEDSFSFGVQECREQAKTLLDRLEAQQ